MRRLGAITSDRYQAAHKELVEWGKDVTDLRQSSSNGALIAEAVGVLRALDKEIRRQSVVKPAWMMRQDSSRHKARRLVSLQLTEVAEEVAGSPLHVLASEKIRGG